MKPREVITLAAVTFLLGAVLSLWIAVKWICPKEEPIATTTLVEHWREIEKRVTDTIRQVEVRREQLAGEVVTVIEYVDRFDSAQVDSCLAGIPAKTLCLEHSLFPILQAQVKNGDTLAGLLHRKINFKDSISNEQDKIIATQAKDNKKLSAGLKWAKRGYVALTGLFIYLYIKKP